MNTKIIYFLKLYLDRLDRKHETKLEKKKKKKKKKKKIIKY